MREPSRVQDRATRKHLAVVALALAMAAGCGGRASGHAAASTTTSAAVSTSVTTATATTAPSLRDQLIAIHKAYIAALDTCTENDPGHCDFGRYLVAGSPIAQGIGKYLADLVAKGYRTRKDPGPLYAVYEGLELTGAGTSASLTICTVDGGTTFSPHAGPHGEDVVVNGQLESDLSQWVYHLDGTAWRLFQVMGKPEDEWKGFNGCPPNPGS